MDPSFPRYSSANTFILENFMTYVIVSEACPLCDHLCSLESGMSMLDALVVVHKIKDYLIVSKASILLHFAKKFCGA